MGADNRPTESCSRSLLRRVAEEEGVDEIDLPPLQGTVDVDALETLVSAADYDSLTVTFRYCGYQVSVRSDGDVTVEGRDE